MKRSLPLVAGLGVLATMLFLKKKRSRRNSGPLGKLREGIEDALDDAEGRTEELRERAKKLSGDAKKRMQEQVHELEGRQKELRDKLEELKAEAGKLLERARH